MPIDADTLKTLIDTELDQLSDMRVATHIRSLLVEPNAVLRDWDYGNPGEQYPCWTVLNHHDSYVGIAFCEYGFGPRNPWGLVSRNNDPWTSMGMDSGWFPTFLDAYFDSVAAALPIWRVFKAGSSGVREPITEDSWEATWERVYELRKADPLSGYGCSHSIAYKR